MDNKDYIKKMRFALLLKYLLHYRYPVMLSAMYMDWQHIDFEDWTIAKTRGFPAGVNFLEKFRIRPNAALMRNLHQRLVNYTAEIHSHKISNYMNMNLELTKNGIMVPGCAAGTNRSCWLQSMLVSNKAQFREFAKINGINCYRGATQIKYVPVPKVRYSEPKPEYKEPS